MKMKLFKYSKSIVSAIIMMAVCTGSLYAQEALSGNTKTLYGNDTAGDANGPVPEDVRFKGPTGLAFDKGGNMYIAETTGPNGGKRIRKIAPSGEVSVFAGSVTGNQPGTAGGLGTKARFTTPIDVAVHPVTGDIYVADANRIRKITPAGLVSTFAGSLISGHVDGAPDKVKFNYLAGIAIDKVGNIYVADRGNHRVCKYTVSTGLFTTLAGSTQGYQDGTGAEAMFNMPHQLDVDDQGNVYVTDRMNRRIRKITPEGIVTTIAGSGQRKLTDGKGRAASFYDPFGVAVAENGDIYISEYGGHRLRKIDAYGNVATVAGSGTPGLVDGVGTEAQFDRLAGIAIGPDKNLYGLGQRGSVRLIEISAQEKK